MNIDCAIKNVVQKILYNSRPVKTAKLKIYNNEVEQFLKKSRNVDNVNFGKVWIHNKPQDREIKDWVSSVEQEMKNNLKFS